MTTPMDFGDKEFDYGAGYPAPFSIPDETVCRTFKVPADDENGEWLALVMGVMATLTDPANITQFEGALDPEVVAQRWLEMLNDAYDRADAGCAVLLPSGDRVFRINASSGHVEELLDDDTWGEPVGDAAIPPVPAREGGSSSDQICLAATNAVNVYSQVYEQITDAIGSGASDTEAWALAIAAFIAAVGAEFAPITTALAIFFLTIILSVVEIIRFVGADLWTEDFTNTFICLLIGCATNDAGVVTFDYTCVQNALAANTSVFDLTASQLRLFGQLMFIIQATGGVDGLNQAGATTAITEASCDFCAPTCYQIDFRTDQDETGVDNYSGTWVDGDGYQSFCFGSVQMILNVGIIISPGCANPCDYSRVELEVTVTGSPSYYVYALPVCDYSGHQILLQSGTAAAGTYTLSIDVDPAQSSYGLQIIYDYGLTCAAGSMTLHLVRIFSPNLADAGLMPNCPA